MSTQILRNDDEKRYEIHVDGVLAGFTEIIPRGERLIFPHTEVFPEFAGKGLAGELVDYALKDATARGETIDARCPYVVKYIETHDIPGIRLSGQGAESSEQ